MITALLLHALLAQGYYLPAEAQAMFAHGNEAFSKDDFATARLDFERLLEHGYGGPDVLYNLGTTALAEGDLGEAVLQLERARREEGSALDVDGNLSVARSRQLDQVVGGDFGPGLLERVANATSEDAAGWIVLAFVWVGFFALLLRRIWPRTRGVASAAVAASALLLSLPAGGVFLADVYARLGLQTAVVTAKSLAARDAPRDSGKTAFEVHAGLKVRLVSNSGKFVRLRLPNGLEGWVERSGVTSL